MGIEIEFYNQTGEETGAFESQVQTVIEAAAKRESLAGKPIEMSVIFVTDEEIRQINSQYRQKDAVTDVITFAMEDEVDGEIQIKGIPMPRMLGDVFIALPRTREQAARYGHSFTRELSFLAVHGFLHLLGYDHQNEADEQVMFGKQEAILNELGIQR
ncbi:MAG: rRNA maturation RNase YbeY [Turicibacter sp.]|nr:rRNA maturation RNase YbeY [Turicibacter sp.]